LKWKTNFALPAALLGRLLRVCVAGAWGWRDPKVTPV
jgi:hypothetical protein